MASAIVLDNRLRRLATDLNRALTEQLETSGDLSTPAWRGAFEAVPRYLFVPRFTLPDNLGGGTHDAATAKDSAGLEAWLRALYHNDALLTAFDEYGIATSSCSAPAVVATMLERSQVSEGDTVLEIGTGTGWTAGLLAHRLGSGAVTSVDTNAQFVADARERLARLGYTPTLAVADGFHGYPPRAPYDRIVATAAVRKVPPAWLAQTRPGGTILTDLRGDFAGNLARLTVNPDHSARGHFLSDTVRFMSLRSTEQPFQLASDLSARAVREPGGQRETALAPAALRKGTFRFLAQLALPGTEVGHVIARNDDGTRGPMYFCLTDPHTRSWARIEDDITATTGVDTTAGRMVTQGGERRLWRELEAAHDLWTELGQPSPDGFTITITPEGEQTVHLPGTDRSWSLPL